MTIMSFTGRWDGVLVTDLSFHVFDGDLQFCITARVESAVIDTLVHGLAEVAGAPGE